jgi:hypothetical protein
MTTSTQAPTVLGTAATPVSLTTLSPLQQGDAVCGLVLAVAGVGPAPSAQLPAASWPVEVDARDAWGVALGSETGWYALCSQDCDVVRTAAEEPTVLVAPLTLVDETMWKDLVHNGYSSRWWPYPSDKFSGIPAGKALVVDLAWTTSVLKGSLASPAVHGQRPLTGPNRPAFAEWLAARTGRAPFGDDVVASVLEPCYQVRTRLAKQFDKNPLAAPLEARAVGSVARWFAHVDGRHIDVLGQTSGPLLQQAGFVKPDDGKIDAPAFDKARNRLEQAIVKRMLTAAPQSGFTLRVTLADLDTVSAQSFLGFALLMR